ncbi:DUF421 domain-containing protein [Gangjinia marincola]|uniref:DUF421 domain-containing protein n=1 Tax=Gangjinia marincola TaxID=578463 RepID=A0ABN1MIS3_9FLAO
MFDWIYDADSPLLKVALSIIAIFIVMITITRISGLRTFAKMSSFDFASTIAVGTILGAIILHPEESIVKGAVALSGIIAFQTLFSLLVRKMKWFRSFATNTPLLLMEDGEILYDNLKSANIGKTDLIAKLREANVLEFSEVQAVVLESTGDMSVLHTNENKSLNDDLLEGVRRK